MIKVGVWTQETGFQVPSLCQRCCQCYGIFRDSFPELQCTFTNHGTPQQHSWILEQKGEDDGVPALQSLCAENTAKVALLPKCPSSRSDNVQWQPREPGQVSEGTTEPSRTTEGNQGKATEPAGRRSHQRQLLGSVCAWGVGRLGTLHRMVSQVGRGAGQGSRMSP